MSISAKDLQFSYFEDSPNIINRLNAEISGEEITVLTGVSGCGKSTFLYLAAGIYPHNAGYLNGGSVTIDGQNMADLAPSVRCQKAGMMFQNPDLQFCMDTVFNEMVFCLENIRLEPGQRKDRIEEALDFCGISHLSDRKLNTLSGGEKQKAMLACITALDPEWLLLDEPFANIDDRSAQEIIEKLNKLHTEKGTAILAVDHRIDNWLGICDRICIMEDGGITDIKADPSEEKQVFDILRSKGIYTPDTEYSPIEEAQDETSGPVLTIDRLSLSFKYEEPEFEKLILDDISFSFRPGIIYALTGESGSGKSSLFGALTGLYKYSGTILLEGKDTRKFKKQDAGKIGFITQNPQDQFIGGTVLDEVSAAFGDDPDKDEKSEKILRSIKLWRYREISPYMLSQGQQRRLGTAALMAYDCHVLVCDEPTYAQDVRNTAAIMEGLCSLARKNRTALIFSTHDMKVAKHFSDHVLVLKGGKLVETDKSLL